MGITTGIAAIKAAAGAKMSNRAKFFGLKDGESRTVRFLQEIDPDSTYADEDAGLGALVVEYRHPDDFKRRAVDTSSPEDGGRCWMAEQGWRPKKSLYIYVEELDGPNPGELRILNQGFGKSTISDTVVDFADTYGTLRDRPYKITRNGSAWNNTSYSIIPLKEFDPSVVKSSLEPFVDKMNSWDETLNKLPYEEQEAYFNRGNADEQASAEPTPVTW